MAVFQFRFHGLLASAAGPGSFQPAGAALNRILSQEVSEGQLIAPWRAIVDHRVEVVSRLTLRTVGRLGLGAESRVRGEGEPRRMQHREE